MLTSWHRQVERDGAVAVVDAGVPTSWSSFLSALRELGRRPDDVDAVVLTHAHSTTSASPSGRARAGVS